MGLSAETQAFLGQMVEAGAEPFHTMQVADARAVIDSLAELAGPVPEMHQSEDVALPVSGGEITLKVLTPVKSPRAVIVYLHGGGWVLGSAEGWAPMVTQLAEATGAVVVLVDYRLAPEHPFPTPVDDSWAALQWAADEFALPLFVAGDSAGGNLAAVLAQMARDAGGPAIAGQLLLYPATDSDPSRPSYVSEENQLLLTAADMEWFFNFYVSDTAVRQDPRVSPIRAETLQGLPPALVLSAEFDVLRDDGEAYAEALRSAGVAVTAKRFDGETHAFMSFGAVLPRAREARKDVADFISNIIR